MRLELSSFYLGGITRSRLPETIITVEMEHYHAKHVENGGARYILLLQLDLWKSACITPSGSLASTVAIIRGRHALNSEARNSNQFDLMRRSWFTKLCFFLGCWGLNRHFHSNYGHQGFSRCLGCASTKDWCDERMGMHRASGLSLKECLKVKNLPFWRRSEMVISCGWGCFLSRSSTWFNHDGS